MIIYDYSNYDDGYSNHDDGAFGDHQVRQNVASYAPIYSKPVHANVISYSSAYCWQSRSTRLSLRMLVMSAELTKLVAVVA